MTGVGRSARWSRWPATLAVLALLGSGCARAYGDAFAPVAAVVGGQAIPDAEVVGTLRLQLNPQATAQLGGDGREVRYLEAKRAVLAGLIQTEVMVAQARGLDVSVTDGEVAERVDRVRGRFDSEEKFQAALRIAGLTSDGLRTQLRKGLLQDKVAAEASKGAVSEQELRQAYDASKGLFDVEVHVAHILICSKADPASGECAVNSAEDDNVAALLTKRLRSGEDFADLVRRFTTDKATANTGGDLGWLNQGQVPDAFGNAIARLQPGEVSDPVRTVLGVHVVKLLARGRSFEEAREEIEQRIGGDRLRRAVGAFLRKAIASTSIRVNPRYGRFDPRTQSVVANELAGR